MVAGRTSRELVESIEAAVRSGEFPPGAVMPSVRSLAARVGVSHTTVATALGELRRRGVIITESRRRARVALTPPLAMSMSPSAPPPGVKDVRHGGPDPELLPDVRPALIAAANELSSPRVYGLPHIDPELASFASEWFSGEGVEGQHVAVCGGALDAVQRALETALRPGDAVAVEDPGYADLYDLVRALDLRLVPVPVTAEGPDPDALAAALRGGARAVVVNPVGQNPLGASISEERRSELNAVVRERPGTLVVEDQHLSFIAQPARSITAGLDRWLVVRTLSKAYGPDLRIAVAAGDATTIARVRGRLAVGPGWVSHVLQRTALHLLTDDGISADLETARALYDERRRALLERLADHGIAATGCSGLNVWVPVSDESSSALALQDGWAVAPGTPFRLKSAPAIRLTSSTLPVDAAKDLAAATARALTSHRGRQG